MAGAAEETEPRERQVPRLLQGLHGPAGVLCRHDQPPRDKANRARPGGQASPDRSGHLAPAHAAGEASKAAVPGSRGRVCRLGQSVRSLGWEGLDGKVGGRRGRLSAQMGRDPEHRDAGGPGRDLAARGSDLATTGRAGLCRPHVGVVCETAYRLLGSGASVTAIWSRTPWRISRRSTRRRRVDAGP